MTPTLVSQSNQALLSEIPFWRDCMNRPALDMDDNRPMVAAGAGFIRTLQLCRSVIEQYRFTQDDFRREILVACCHTNPSSLRPALLDMISSPLTPTARYPSNMPNRLY